MIPLVSLRADRRHGLLPVALVEEVWAKWSALKRLSGMHDNPEAACHFDKLSASAE
jgi:hypothetical protein